MKKVDEEGEPYLFKFDLFGLEVRVDYCLLWRLIIGVFILAMVITTCTLVIMSLV